ncbi:hypothetical protein [Mucilaginibacter aquaedulcis]|uniref:hypothetical protein n=1 Tax=Mucilaginibacter aquaedulcis TaxID=1187081 RepID=UPI0025B3A317|nr:hypothetical protein [Mucilaginibacter aquaedulcis]MDN3550493.1 hypothetical protein [Mucilaginibacter aquaedulcis]
MKMQNDVDSAVSFEINNLLYMTESLNQWLSKAITLPENYNEAKYYYDKQQSELFVVTKNDNVLINSTNIVEIPRLTLKERIAIQMDFIYRIENFRPFDQVALEIKKQDTSSTFVLDNLLLTDRKLNLLIDYWSEFKMEQLNYAINDFEDEHDINLKVAKIRNSYS